jgi:tRNA(Ile)-lysidine synthase
MLRTMQATIRENQLLAAGDEVLVALSGGPDSVALLEGLLQLSTSLSISISAAHLNHRLRGWESDEDERFVRSLAAKRGVRLIVEARDVKGVQRREGGSLEEVARRARYAFLREAAKRSGCKKIALGHNSEDNAETILMNLLRGSGLTGLSGIPFSRREGEFNIIRPLLGVSKSEILSFLKEQGLAYREDSSNQDESFTRNKIRHTLLPFLEKEFNPQIKKVLTDTGRHLWESERCISAAIAELAEECLSTDRSKPSFNVDRLQAHARVLAWELLRRVLQDRLGLRVDRRALSQIWQLVTGARTEKIGLGKGWAACVEYDELVFVPESALSGPPFEKALQIPSDVFLADLGIQISASYVKGKEARGRSKEPLSLGEAWRRAISDPPQVFEEFFDASAVSEDRILVRTRREGDVFRPLGMNGSKKVKELFIDEKIPLSVRDKIPIFWSGDEILWVVGSRPAARFAVKRSSRKVLRLMVKLLYCPEWEKII